jgi:hypothetical protein
MDMLTRASAIDCALAELRPQVSTSTLWTTEEEDVLQFHYGDFAVNFAVFVILYTLDRHLTWLCIDFIVDFVAPTLDAIIGQSIPASNVAARQEQRPCI